MIPDHSNEPMMMNHQSENPSRPTIAWPMLSVRIIFAEALVVK